MPTLLNNSGLVIGNSTVSLNTLIWSFKPPISLNSIAPGSSFYI